MTEILIIEDDPAQSLLLSEFLKTDDIIAKVVDNGYEAQEIVKHDSPKLVLVDLGLPDIDGMELIRRIRRLSKDSEIIIVTGQSDASSAMQAVQLGATDYLVKPVTKERLLITVRNVLERAELSFQVRKLQNANDQETHFHGLIGQSNNMQRIFKIVDIIARNHDNFFMNGETGSGRSKVARVIHELRGIQDEFISINCNYATTADIEKITASPNIGTVYFKDISLLEHDLQSAVLKFIESNQNINICASSNNSIPDDLHNNHLHKDLYHYFSSLIIDLPPLRERGKDVHLIATYFLKTYSRGQEKNFLRFDTETLQTFESYHWPGNVKELQNVVKGITTLNDNAETVTIQMLPAYLQQLVVPTKALKSASAPDSTKTAFFEGSDITPICDLEQMAIKHALNVCKGNVQEAALKLKISPATLYRKKPEKF